MVLSGQVPVATKYPVCLRIDEDVVEHVMAHLHGVGVVAHVEPGGEVYPFAIVFGELELSVGGIFRTVESDCGVTLWMEGQSRTLERLRGAERVCACGEHVEEYAPVWWRKGLDRLLHRSGDSLHLLIILAERRIRSSIWTRTPTAARSSRWILDYIDLARLRAVRRDADGFRDAWGGDASRVGETVRGPCCWPGYRGLW